VAAGLRLSVTSLCVWAEDTERAGEAPAFICSDLRGLTQPPPQMGIAGGSSFAR
jgi:hypothetical protein